jgi:hypothetical protein
MKKVILVMATCLICLVATGQQTPNSKSVKKDQIEKYCTMYKNGKLVVMHGKNEIKGDVKLASGIVIKQDGTVIRNDNSITTLRIGECVDNETTVINPKNNDIFNREKDQNVDLAKTK